MGRASDPSAARQPGAYTSSRKVSTRLAGGQHAQGGPGVAAGVAAGMAVQGHAAMRALAAVDAGDAAPHHRPTAV